jgi:hypothetical protein
MPELAVSDPPPRTGRSSLPILFALAAVCAVGLASVPRALVPSEMPALVLPTAAVAAVLQQDSERAAAAPHSQVANELMTRYLDFGASEIAALEDQHLLRLRRRTLHSAYARVVAQHGADAGLALRALTLSKFEAALDSQLPTKEIKSLLGLFPNVLAQHRATRDGEEQAPHFVVRTLYKARWNRMLDLDPDFGFARIERVAYFGWLGLQAENLPLSVRRQALQDYAVAGGPHASEAQGILAFAQQDYPHAVSALTDAYNQTPSLRLRNYLRGALVAARATVEADAPGSQVAANLRPRSHASQ